MALDDTSYHFLLLGVHLQHVVGIILPVYGDDRVNLN